MAAYEIESASRRSASRIAPTRPSIMSLGATASAPASTWLTAVRASSSSVSSFVHLARRASTPQWPCDVYSQRQTSVTSTSSGCSARERPERLLDDPVLDPRARALVVLLLGDSEEEHGLDAERGKLAGLRDEVLDRVARHPRQLVVRRRSSARRRAAGRSRRARAASRARASGAHRCAAAGATAWRERRSSPNRVRQPGREKSLCWNNTSSGRQPRDTSRASKP